MVGLFVFQDSIRVVLGNLDNLQPFATEHFIVFPCILSFLDRNELQITLEIQMEATSPQAKPGKGEGLILKVVIKGSYGLISFLTP